MNDTTGDMWRRMGTSVVWHADAIHEAAKVGCTVSLREALAWADAMPEEPPEDVRVVVVTGLQTAMDVLPDAERDRLLAKLNRLVRTHSRKWSNAALVFAVEDRTRFSVKPPTGSLHFRLGDGNDIDIGSHLWWGAASEAERIMQSVRDAKGRASPDAIGYWLRRVS